MTATLQRRRDRPLSEFGAATSALQHESERPAPLVARLDASNREALLAWLGQVVGLTSYPVNGGRDRAGGRMAARLQAAVGAAGGFEAVQKLFTNTFCASMSSDG